MRRSSHADSSWWSWLPGTITTSLPGLSARPSSVRGSRLYDPGGAARRRLADHLREHEADVLGDDFELANIPRAPTAEVLHQPLDELFGSAGAGGDADHPLARQPFLAHLQLVVDQLRLGAVVARHL